MTDAALPATALDEAAAGLAEVAAGFAEQAGGPPTLAELLEIIGWSLPVHSDATDGTFTEPLTIRANLKGNKRYQSELPSRVPELNDHVFEEAAQRHLALVERVREADGAPVTPQRFVSAILEVLRTGRVSLADVSGDEIRKLTAEVPKKRVAKPGPGDVVAIPAASGGYRLAVVLTQNRFGTALGLFDGISARGRRDAAVLESPRPHPVYTEDSLVKKGEWKIVGHDEELRKLFPADPPIYHRPAAWPGIDTGEFGAAETADGTLRLIGSEEARAVGLSDGSYRVAYPAVFLQRQLDQDALPRG